MTGRRVLLIGPTFHGYTAAIGDGLQSRGHEVHRWEYDSLDGLGAKIHHKVRHELPDLLGGAHGWRAQQSRTTDEAIRIVRQVRPDIVVAIKADPLLPDFWAAVGEVGALRHLWLYDEIRRMRHAPGTLDIVDRVATYSAQDARALNDAGYQPLHIPNAFDSRLPHGSTIPSDHVLFVGARYPNRAGLLEALVAAGVDVLAVGRGWSHHPYDRIRTWELRRPSVPNMRDVSRAQAYAMMAGAMANVNSHFDQDGFTMRTFEIPGVGGVQLIDRPDISDYYEPDHEVLIYGSADELLELCHRIASDRAWARTLGERAQRRTLAEHTLAHRVALLESQWH